MSRFAYKTSISRVQTKIRLSFSGTALTFPRLPMLANSIFLIRNVGKGKKRIEKVVDPKFNFLGTITISVGNSLIAVKQGSLKTTKYYNFKDPR